MSPPDARPRPRWALARLWLPPFLLFFALMALWSIATPFGASPDEPSHVERAASLVRGDLLGASVPGKGNGPYTSVLVPGVYATYQYAPNCYVYRPDVSAACVHAHPPLPAGLSVDTYTGRYPPLYYAFVGLPSLLTTHSGGIRMMRLVSAALCAAMLALAWAAARRWSSSRLLPAGILLAATPLALFLAGTVNPSSLEIAAAVALWTSAVVLVSEHAKEPPPALVAVVAVSASVTALVRSDSVVWLGIVAAAMLPLAVGRLRVRALLRRPYLPAAGVIGVAVALSVAWTVVAHGLRTKPLPVPSPNTLHGALATSFTAQPLLLKEAIGVFGWLDTEPPGMTDAIWYVLVGVAVGLAFLAGRRRELVALAVPAAMFVIVPLAITVETWRTTAFELQGRYFLPIAAGVPILALASPRFRGLPASAVRRLCWAVGVLVAVAQLGAFYYALRRYHVGASGPMFGTSGVPANQIWNPPFGATAVDILFLVACVAIPLLLVRRRGEPAAQVAPAALGRSESLRNR